jgi:hypothetical protein
MNHSLFRPGRRLSISPQAVGFFLTATGATLLAMNDQAVSKWGWLLFLAANFAWIIHGLARGEKWWVAQNAYLTATSLLGIYRAFT